MKITEIFGSDTSVSQDTTTEPGAPQQTDGFIGSGNFGRVFKHPIDPALVQKQSKLAAELFHDGYYRYIQWVVSNHLAEENIHFPRVYSIKLHKLIGAYANDHNEESLYTIDMERLIPYHEISLEEQNALFEATLLHVQPEHGEPPYFTIINKIDAYMQHYGATARDFKDKLLVEAMDQITAFRIKNDFMLDIKVSNIMLRRIGVGLQLVFVDPLF